MATMSGHHCDKTWSFGCSLRGVRLSTKQQFIAGVSISKLWPFTDLGSHHLHIPFSPSVDEGQMKQAVLCSAKNNVNVAYEAITVFLLEKKVVYYLTTVCVCVYVWLYFNIQWATEKYILPEKDSLFACRHVWCGRNGKWNGSAIIFHFEHSFCPPVMECGLSRTIKKLSMNK